MTDDASTGFRPVDLRLPLAAEAFQGTGLVAEVLPLLAVGTDGVRGGDLRPFPAAEGRAEHSGADDDAPMVGGHVADGDVDAAEADRLVADLDDDFAVRSFVDDGIPRPTTQDVGDVVEASGPAPGRDHEGAQCSTSR